MHGLVTDIQRFSLHDGPGIRTTIFLKGCNFRCFWCHNPETIRPTPEIQVYPEQCIGCGACVNHCTQGALSAHGYQRERCTACGACARACYAGARVLVGSEMDIDTVLETILQDREFYRDSGGGITISGGEPLMQRDFTLEILRRCKADGIATAMESNLAWPWVHIAPLLPVLDQVMMDIKLMDEERHREHTGHGNQLVLDNARALARTGIPLIVRTPVIPGVNDTPEAINAIAAFVATLPTLQYYELLPFHPLGEGKYASLGLPCRTQGIPALRHDDLRPLADAAIRHQIPVRIAGKAHLTVPITA